MKLHLVSITALLLTPLGASCTAESTPPGITIHVAPTGDDASPGTAAKPLATIAGAQRAARISAGRKAVTVLLHEGVYYLRETLHCTAEDSGAENVPVV